MTLKELERKARDVQLLAKELEALRSELQELCRRIGIPPRYPEEE